MKESILNDKWVLGIDSRQDVLDGLREKILKAAPNCHFDKATTYQEAFEFLVFFMYDLVILDNAFSRSRDLLDFAVNRPFPVPVAILTSRSAIPEALRLTKELGAKAVVAKEEPKNVIPTLEYILWYKSLSPLARVIERSRIFFNARLSFSESKNLKSIPYFASIKNRRDINKGYKADISLGWERFHLKLKNHLNGYFESCPEKEINLKWPEGKSEIDIGIRSEVKV